jgi:O-antigen/teichoic acid export membrane protein
MSEHPGSEEKDLRPAPRSSIARNALNLLLGQVGTMVLGILFSAALGRKLGAGDFGLYFLVSSFAVFALVVVDWGQQFFGIRAVARAPERGRELLGTGLVLRSVGTLLVCIPAGLGAWALGYDRRTIVYAVAFVALSLPFFLAQNFGIVFRGHDRMGLDSIVSVTNRAVGLVLALAVLAVGWGVGAVVVIQGIAGAVALGVALRLYRRIDGGPLRFSALTAREILGGGTAIVVMTVASNVQPYLDAVLLSKLAPKDAVGWYAAAKGIMGTLLAPALILASAAFPRLSRAAHDTVAFRREFTLAERPMLWLGGLAAAGTWLFSDLAIHVVYGRHAFEPAAVILRVFGLALFLVFVDFLLGYSLTALGRSTGWAVVKIVTVVVAAGLELFLIGYFQRRSGNGGIGVVVAFGLCELGVFVGSLLLMPRGTLGASLPLDAGRSLASALITVFVCSVALHLPGWAGIPVCIAVFTLCSLGLGLLRRDDVQVLKELLGRGSAKATATPEVESAGTPIP